MADACFSMAVVWLSIASACFLIAVAMGEKCGKLKGAGSGRGLSLKNASHPSLVGPVPGGTAPLASWCGAGAGTSAAGMGVRFPCGCRSSASSLETTMERVNLSTFFAGVGDDDGDEEDDDDDEDDEDDDDDDE